MHYRSALFLTICSGSVALACSSTTSTKNGGAPSGSGSSEPGTCTTKDQCEANESCEEGVCVEATGGTEIGSGDGSAESVTFTQIYKSTSAAEFTDLAFNGSDTTQLWVIAYNDDSVHIGTGVGAESNGTWKRYYDPAAGHFMHKPPAFAWGETGLWGICGDNDNSQNDPRREPNYFMGPALFTSDMAIFAKSTEGGLGSHVDMLHNTSFCRGIAHVEKNVFWTFNGELGSLEMYNFNTPHEPGGDDHSDGEIYRYVEGQVKGVEGVSSHLFYDAADKFLYVADTGNKRIVRLDTTKGTKGGRLSRRNEVLKASAVMNGVDVEEIVPPGALEQPSGLEVKGGLLYVTDAATSTFHVFDKTGKELRSLATGLPAQSLSGFTFGPDGKVWFVDRKKGSVVRIDP